MGDNLKSEIIKYGENTSVRGLSKYFKSKDVFLKLLWLGLLLGSTSYMSYRLYLLFSDYLEYPVSTEYGEKVVWFKLFLENDSGYGLKNVYYLFTLFLIIKVLSICDIVFKLNSEIFVLNFDFQIGQSISFPDITLCNLDVFAEGEPKEISVKDYLENLENFKKRFQAILNNKTAIQWNEQHIDMKINGSSSIKLREVDEAFEEMTSLAGYIINLNRSRPQSVDCPHFVVDCNFFGTNWFETKDKCSVSSFARVWNANYYTCYTLKTSKLNVNSSTNIRGLNVLLNVGPPNSIQVPYRSSLTSSQGRGVQVSVHSPGTPPDLKRGFNVAPGTENIVEIIQTNRNRLKLPYNKLGCTEDVTLFSSSSVKYTPDVCIDYCQQNLVKSMFKCFTHQLNVPEKKIEKTPLCGNLSAFMNANMSMTDDDIFFNSILRLSGSLLWSQLDKVYTKLIKYDESTEICSDNCLLPCKETVYQTFITSAAWPQPSVQFDIFKKYYINGGCMDNVKIKNRYINYFNKLSNNTKKEMFSSNLTQMQESLLVLKFMMKQNFPYFQSDNPAYTDDMMIGSVGGMLSLWLGITVASGVEVIELIYLLFKRCWEKKMQNKNTTNVTETTNGKGDHVIDEDFPSIATTSTKL
ncbi:hypothetical protein HELRODRAFT_165877 [Helobdella robusta]|uniref:Uncharacterized protein n=1 Tax=Helobdella robusta TaxID=6412 RepID=T1EXE2_HELRO|nr:hypothetical protein HELRODRAFT_165877 [Helobdella robusta]ESN91797.1 hypothetical protein HELRODRAFT_165877 [Helobdella robusta]